MLAALLLATAAVAPVQADDPAGLVPAVAPPLSWVRVGGGVGVGAVLAASGLRAGRHLLDPADGSTLREEDLACAGQGPVHADLGMRFRSDEETFSDRGELFLLDEHSGVPHPEPFAVIGPLETGSRLGSCAVFAGDGDLALVRYSGTSSISTGASFARATVYRVVDGTATHLWGAGVGYCPSTTAALGPKGPEVRDGHVVWVTSDCSQRFLTARDLRTGDVIAELPIGEHDASAIDAGHDAFAAAVVYGDDVAAYDLVPTAAGPAWVERWRVARPMHSAAVHDGGGVVVLVNGAHTVRVDAATGHVLSEGPATSGWIGDHLVDAAGTHLALGGDPAALVATERGGTVRWTLDLEEAVGFDVRGAASIIDVGPDGSVYVGGHTDDGFEPFVARLAASDAVPDPVGLLRVDAGDDPIDMAVASCHRVTPYGPGARVLIARSDVFADALVGAALAGPDGCVLYVDGGPDAPLDRRTLWETARVLPPGGRVYVLGGPHAVSRQVEADLVATGYDVVRLAGATRIGTAARIAREVVATRADEAPAQTAYLATAGAYADAITASAHAAFAGVPVLLTERDALPDATAEALADLGTTRTVVLGGTEAVGEAVEAAVPGPERIAGATRFDTAAHIATRLWSVDDVSGALVVAIDQDASWPTALAVAPLAARARAPLIGVAQALAPEESIDALQELRASSGAALPVTLFGSGSAVPSAVVRALVG